MARKLSFLSSLLFAMLLLVDGATAQSPRFNTGQDAQTCISYSVTKACNLCKEEVTLTNNCSRYAFVAYCGESNVGGSGSCSSKGRYYQMSHNLDGVGESVATHMAPNIFFRFMACEGSISFGNDGQYEEDGAGGYTCLRQGAAEEAQRAEEAQAARESEAQRQAQAQRAREAEAQRARDAELQRARVAEAQRQTEVAQRAQRTAAADQNRIAEARNRAREEENRQIAERQARAAAQQAAVDQYIKRTQQQVDRDMANAQALAPLLRTALERFANNSDEASAPEANDSEEADGEPRLPVAQELSGTIGGGDNTNASGALEDAFVVDLTAGQSLKVELRSSEFDAFLSATGPDGDTVAEDDDSNGGSDARINFIAVTTGRYRIAVSSFQRGQSGDYTLRADVLVR